jgi:predicted component of type VI protein secretion system
MDEKKIQGSSINKNNYAYDLKLAIEEYETRMNNVRVLISYEAKSKQVSIDVSGQYEEDFTEKDYEKNITFYIW